MRASDKSKIGLNNILNSHDKDFGSDKHDEISMWLYQKLKTHDFLKTIIDQKDFEFIKSTEVILEFPIHGRGFADLVLIYRGKKNYLYNKSKTEYLYEKARSERMKIKMDFDYVFLSKEEVAEKYPQKHGLDFESSFFYESPSSFEDLIFFEVKTSINIGETVRQIRYYNQLMAQHNKPKWFVCSPDKKYAEILKEQNIGFIEYKKDPDIFDIELENKYGKI